MRRLVLLTPLVSVVAIFAGCEDGPNQTFSPTNGTLFNSGDTPSQTDEAGAPLNGNYAGQNKSEICSGDELQRQWAAMVQEPIKPPRFMAGLDLAGGPKFPAIKIDEAENGPLTPINKNGPTRLCQPTVEGPGGNGGDVGGSIQVHWGNNSEVQMEWAVPTHKAYFVTLNPGYLGHITWTYTPKGGTAHNYDFQISHPVLKDGVLFQFDWNDSKKLAAEVDEIYRGIVSTFAPELYFDDPSDCKTTGACAIFPGGNQDGTGRAIIGFRPISFYFLTYNPGLPQPSGSTMASMYTFNIKYAPYSETLSYLKMNDAIGPTSTGAVGDQGKVCNLKLGGTYGDLLDNCVQVFQNPATNDLATNKVLGNIKHDDQNFTFSVVGVNQGYRPVAFDQGGPRQFDVIHDDDLPQRTDYAEDFSVDVRTYAPILNDYYVKTAGTPPVATYKKDRHGSGAVWREWGRLVQTTLAKAYADAHGTTPRPWHDPACFFPMSCKPTVNPPTTNCAPLGFDACGAATDCGWALNFPAGQDIYSWRAPDGCTGFEGHVTAAEPIGAGDGQFNDAANVGGQGVGGFKPGNPVSAFCNDPGIFNFCGFSGDIIGLNTDLLGGAYQRVLQFMGHGDILKVPSEGRDLRFYFKQFMIAYTKYMLSPAASAKGKKATPPDPVPDFGGQFIDTDNLFFDSYGGGAARGEYADLTFATATQDPTDLELKMLLVGSNLQEAHFLRKLDREERAIFQVMAVDKTQAAWGYLKKNNVVVKDEYGFPTRNAGVFLSNLGGSPAAAGIWSAVSPAVAAPPVGGQPAVDPCNPGQPAMKTAYYCATHIDSDCALSAPTDDKGAMIVRENGKPLFEGYCGIWNPTVFAVGGDPSLIKLVETYPLINSAKIEFSNFANPYDTTSASTPLQVLAPWKPQQEGVGFPVATTGTRDVFVKTAELNFEGQVVTPTFDFLPVSVKPGGDAGGAPYTGVSIQAIETQDFLGDVFVCYDAIGAANRVGTGRPGDVLAAHMYTSAQVILDWIAAHPGSQDACGIVVRYSPYNNYPDFVQSSVNGVRLGIEQGAGLGRVSDATIFVPGSGSPAAP